VTVHAVIGWLTLSAYAEPPRAEVILGWAGNGDHGYGFLTVQAALVRGEDAHSSLVLRGTVSELYYTWSDVGVLNRVESPGASIGPGFSYSTEHFGLGAGLGFEARRDSRRIEQGEPERTLELDASLSGNVGWRPGAGTSVYGLATFSAVHQNLWARVGAIQQVIPLLDRGTAVSLWIGPEVSTLGGRETHLFELAGVAEVPVRELHATFSARAGVSTQRLGAEDVRQATGGVGVYWSY
jgi:hypothetical protein